MLLQVALDFTRISDALDVAEKAAKAGVQILEAGTPLIKAEGCKAIAELRKRFPDKQINADMKTMDAGGLEAGLAFDAGADIVAILGVSSDRTIKDAVKVARERNKKIMVDLIGVGDKVKRAKEVEGFGADYILIHSGLDEQASGETPFADLRAVREAVKIPMAVAGGINDKSISLLKGLDMGIVIVGGFITKASDAEDATKIILANMQ